MPLAAFHDPVLPVGSQMKKSSFGSAGSPGSQHRREVVVKERVGVEEARAGPGVL
jgi:hypothetical protein